MTADDIRALRKELAYSQRQLADALKIEVEMVREWEREEHFPTKAHCAAMEAMRRTPTSPPRAGKAMSVMAHLADPRFFTVLRKLLAHPKLRTEVDKLAAAYPDPAEEKDV